MLTIRRTAVVTKAGTSGPWTADWADRFGFVSLLVLSAWSGLVGGLLEVATILASKTFFDPVQFYKVSRHFVWLIPLSNLALSLTVGLFGCGVVLFWPHHGRCLCHCACSVR